MHAVSDDVGIEARLQMLDYTFFKFRRAKTQVASAKRLYRRDAKLGGPRSLRIFPPVSSDKKKKKKRERGRLIFTDGNSIAGHFRDDDPP